MIKTTDGHLHLQWGQTFTGDIKLCPSSMQLYTDGSGLTWARSDDGTWYAASFFNVERQEQKEKLEKERKFLMEYKPIDDNRQFSHPNWRNDKGRLFLVRCFKCNPLNGRENWAMAVATGSCAWCGWEDPKNDKEDENICCDEACE